MAITYYVKIECNATPYKNWDYIMFYDMDGNNIPITYDNVVSHTFRNRTGVSNFLGLFIVGSTSSTYEPYDTTRSDGWSHTVITIDKPFTVIKAKRYANCQDGGTAIIKLSKDGIAYETIETVILNNVETIYNINLNVFAIYKHFLLHNNVYKVYDESISSWLLPLGFNAPTASDYEEYGMETLPVNAIQDLVGYKSLFSYSETEDITKDIRIKTILKPTTITSNNITLSDVHEVQSITLTATNQNASTIKIAVSPTNGSEWFVYRDNEWHISNNIKEDSNTVEEFNTINEAFNTILNINDKKLMFKFCMSLNNINDKLEVDKLSYTVDLKGIFEKVIDTKYRQLYTTNSTVKLELFEDGVYKINY